MNRNDVTKEQAKRISRALDRTTGYLIRLQMRMEKLGFPPADPLYLLVCAAHEVLNRLRLETHYMSCEGVGAPRLGGIQPPTLPERE